MKIYECTENNESNILRQGGTIILKDSHIIRKLKVNDRDVCGEIKKSWKRVNRETFLHTSDIHIDVYVRFYAYIIIMYKMT